MNNTLAHLTPSACALRRKRGPWVPRSAISELFFHFPGKEVSGKKIRAVKGLGAGIQACYLASLNLRFILWAGYNNRIAVSNQWMQVTPDKISPTQEVQSITAILLKRRNFPFLFSDLYELDLGVWSRVLPRILYRCAVLTHTHPPTHTQTVRGTLPHLETHLPRGLEPYSHANRILGLQNLIAGQARSQSWLICEFLINSKIMFHNYLCTLISSKKRGKTRVLPFNLS